MSRYVRIAAVQFSSRAKKGAADAGKLVVEELRGWGEKLRQWRVDLVVFCESVESVGQTLDTAEEIARPGPFLKAYQEMAAQARCHVAGSIKIREAGRVYNSIAFVGPDRIHGVYHKTFLTDGEIGNGLASGKGAVVVDTPVGRLGGIICFDLNFEPLRQQYRALKPDILCFASNYHGGLMQAMWTYDCRSYFASALSFAGAGILDPFGRPLSVTDCYTSVARARVNLDRVMVHLDHNREKFPSIEAKYGDDVRIDIPANIGPALIFSETERFTAMDIVKEFKLELLDDYFERSVALNEKNRGRNKPSHRGKG
jgi:hypothetical protein